MKVVLTGYIKVPLDDLEDVKKHLDDHIKATRDEKGCIKFSFLDHSITVE